MRLLEVSKRILTFAALELTSLTAMVFAVYNSTVPFALLLAALLLLSVSVFLGQTLNKSADDAAAGSVDIFLDWRLVIKTPTIEASFIPSKMLLS